MGTFMKKITFVFILIFSGYSFSEERAYCDLLPFPENSLNAIFWVHVRILKFLKACLDCQGDSCSIKPSAVQSKVCKRVFLHS
ncbi:MAG: hypothetical protein Ct9H90mP4_11290 [Gammaproteobacteria bacterium]|nr:MAG: hypothetical protein Ct9H90mP4_11290 [Gammaproteobacteria bacterium]